MGLFSTNNKLGIRKAISTPSMTTILEISIKTITDTVQTTPILISQKFGSFLTTRQTNPFRTGIINLAIRHVISIMFSKLANQIKCMSAFGTIAFQI